LLNGRNGAVSVRCNPIAASARRLLSFAASLSSKPEATTMTDVALIAPRSRRSRIAALTAREIP